MKPTEITVLVLDRPRHAELIAAIRRVGSGIRLITDGDVAGVIFTTMPEETGIDLYLGIGAAPEGVLAAGALRCVGGQMQGRLILDTEEKRARAAGMGVTDPEPQVRLAGPIVRRRDRGGDGRHRRRAAEGRPLRPQGDRDGDDRVPLGDRHGPPHPRRAPGAVEVPPGLRPQVVVLGRAPRRPAPNRRHPRPTAARAEDPFPERARVGTGANAPGVLGSPACALGRG